MERLTFHGVLLRSFITCDNFLPFTLDGVLSRLSCYGPIQRQEDLLFPIHLKNWRTFKKCHNHKRKSSMTLAIGVSSVQTFR